MGSGSLVVSPRAMCFLLTIAAFLSIRIKSQKVQMTKFADEPKLWDGVRKDLADSRIQE